MANPELDENAYDKNIRKYLLKLAENHFT